MHHAILIYGAAAAARPALLPKERVCLPYALAPARLPPLQSVIILLWL